MNPSPRYAALERAAWALVCVFVFSIPWEKSVWIGSFGTLSHVLGVLAFAAAALTVAWRRSLRRPNLALLWATLFVAWSAVTWFWSMDRPATVARIITFTELLVMTFLIWELCRGPARQMQLLAAYVSGAVAGSANAIARYLEGQQTYYRRYAAAGFDPNDFGLILAISIPMTLYLAMKSEGWLRWACRAAAVVILCALLLTASRTALVAAYCAFGFALWTWRSGGWQHRITSVALLLVLALGMVRLAPAPSRARLATLPTELTKGTLHNRTLIWKSGLKVLKQHPVLGVGAGAYPEAVRPWLGTPGVPGHHYVAHNSFLSVLVESGIVGFAIYSLLLGTVAVFIWMMPSTERALWAVTLAVWAVGVSTLTWEQYKPSWLILALAMTEWARTYWREPEKP